MPKLIIEVGVLLESPAQQLKPKAQLSLSPQLSSKLSNEAQVRLSSVGHYVGPNQEPVLSNPMTQRTPNRALWKIFRVILKAVE